MEGIARVYADALFGAAKDAGKLDLIKEQLGEVDHALRHDRNLELFFFSPYFSSAEKSDGVAMAFQEAEPELVNFLQLLAEKHRMPVIARVRRRFDDLWADEHQYLDVRLTSAVELDRGVVDGVAAEIERRAGHQINLETRVDEGILGGLVLRAGNIVLDASLRSKLERLRREIVQPV